jgi:hypothetical protein
MQTTIPAARPASAPRWLLPVLAGIVAVTLIVVLFVSVANGNDSSTLDRSRQNTQVRGAEHSNRPARAF